MVIPKLPKLEPWVRFPSPAPIHLLKDTLVNGGLWCVRSPFAASMVSVEFAPERRDIFERTRGFWGHYPLATAVRCDGGRAIRGHDEAIKRAGSPQPDTLPRCFSLRADYPGVHILEVAFCDIKLGRAPQAPSRLYTIDHWSAKCCALD